MIIHRHRPSFLLIRLLGDEFYWRAKRTPASRRRTKPTEEEVPPVFRPKLIEA